MSTYTDYELSEEYRDRFSLNKGERYWMSEAFKFYKREIQEELKGMIEKGERPFIHPSFFDQFFIDIENKLDMWMKTEKVYEDE